LIKFHRPVHSDFIKPDRVALPFLYKLRYVTECHCGNAGISTGGLPVVQQDDRFAVFRNLDAAELRRLTEYVMSTCGFDHFPVKPESHTVTVLGKCIPGTVKLIQIVFESVVLLT